MWESESERVSSIFSVLQMMGRGRKMSYFFGGEGI